MQGACGQTQRVVHEMCQVALVCDSASCVKLAIIVSVEGGTLLRAIFGGNLRGMGAKIHHSTFPPPVNSNTTTTSRPPPLLPQLHLRSFLSRSSSITAQHVRSHPSAAAPTPGWPDIHSIPFSESFHHRSSAQPGGVCCGQLVPAIARPIISMGKRSRPAVSPAMSWNANSAGW